MIRIRIATHDDLAAVLELWKLSGSLRTVTDNLESLAGDRLRAPARSLAVRPVSVSQSDTVAWGYGDPHATGAG